MKPLALLVAFLAAAPAVFAFNQATDLRGITTVQAAVADLPQDLVTAGVHREVLAAQLAEALRSGGLTVLAGDSARGTVPTVLLRVSAARAPDGRIYAVDVAVDCLDNVSSRRAAGEFAAVVWSRDVLSLLGAINDARFAASEKTLVDLFLADWLLGRR